MSKMIYATQRCPTQPPPREGLLFSPHRKEPLENRAKNYFSNISLPIKNSPEKFKNIISKADRYIRPYDTLPTMVMRKESRNDLSEKSVKKMISRCKNFPAEYQHAKKTLAQQENRPAARKMVNALDVQYKQLAASTNLKWQLNSTDSQEQRAKALCLIHAWNTANDPKKELNLSGLGLNSVPPYLPRNVQILDISHNKLTDLVENLPDKVTHLNMSHNQFKELPPNLPQSITFLKANNNHLERLPKNMPSHLETLIVAKNNLRQFPDNLPDNITHIDASNNLLRTCPKQFPPNLAYLDLKHNQLAQLSNNLPSTLSILDVDQNKLEQLPVLSEGLFYLLAGNNELTSLPEIPKTLQSLRVNNNKLTKLPENVSGYLRIYADNNPVTTPASQQLVKAAHNNEHNHQGTRGLFSEFFKRLLNNVSSTYVSSVYALDNLKTSIRNAFRYFTGL